MSKIRVIASKILKRPNRISEIAVRMLEFVRQDNKNIQEFVDELKKQSNYKQGAINAPMRLNKIACIEDWENLEFQQTLLAPTKLK